MIFRLEHARTLCPGAPGAPGWAVRTARASMGRNPVTEYDAVRYPTNPKPQTHPDRLATMATLFGMSPAPVTRCRVLELACGTGGNLIPMAFALPDSRFTGIDLAAEPVAEGCRMVERLGLTNIRLLAMDLMEFGAEHGECDYIIAHGLYSWVAPQVRERILDLCHERLAPHGVAFISYNAYPGFHLRRVTRDMMRYHVESISSPAERIAQARSLAKFVAGAQAGNDLDGVFLKHEFEEILGRASGALYHDDLSDHNTAFYFRQFAGDVRRRGLEYLGEVDYFAMQDHLYGEEVKQALQPLSGDIVRKEQYLDFIRCRRFRQTLVCRAGVELNREVRPAQMRCFHFSCPARSDSEGRFEGAKGAAVKPVHPLAAAAIQYLADRWPGRIGFAELLAQGGGSEADAPVLEEILLGCFAAGLIEAHVWVPPFVTQPGPRPRASPLARIQLAEGTTAANLCHAVTLVDDESGRKLVQLLDGSRDRAALARELGVTVEELEPNLSLLGRMALLVA